MHRAFVIFLIVPFVFLTGCTNAFIENYSGETFPSLKYAQALTGPPADAQMIGSSTFVSDETSTNDDAIAAAKKIGANYVVWDKAFKKQTTEMEMKQIYQKGTDGSKNYQTVSIPVPETVNWYRYHARFYRSNAEDDDPESPQSQ